MIVNNIRVKSDQINCIKDGFMKKIYKIGGRERERDSSHPLHVTAFIKERFLSSVPSSSSSSE